MYSNKTLKMPKRVAPFNEITTKKFKMNNDINDLWGEDPDIDDIDDCLLLATQVCEQEIAVDAQRNNVSILPTYDTFKQTEKFLFTSTQSNSQPSTSFQTPITNGLHNTGKYDKIQEYQDLILRIREKEGEVSILRSQLNQTKATFEAERAKKEEEWTEKLNTTLKEKNAIKSDLEFKNLEIVNLKSKFIEVTKLYNMEQIASLNKSVQNGICIDKKFYKLKPIFETMFPLLVGIESCVFNNSTPENYETKLQLTELCKNDHFLTKEDGDIVELLKAIMHMKNFKIDCIFIDISVLMKCTSLEINCEKYRNNITNIVVISKFVIENFYKYLLMLESNMQNENIRQLDNVYLENRLVVDNDVSVFDSKEMCKSELGVKPRQMIAVISEILPHSNYLQYYLIENKIVFDNEDFLKYYSDGYDYLNLILSVIIVIGKIRKSEKCVGFFCAVCMLLTNICITKKLDFCFSTVLKILKEIVFSRPPQKVLCNLSMCLKVASINRTFSEELCKMPQNKDLKDNTKEGITYFNKDSCFVQVLTTLYEDAFINVGDFDCLEVYFNVLQFIKNLLNSNTVWLYHQENKHCECLCKVNNLCIVIIYECVKVYREPNMKLDKLKPYNVKCKEILRYSIHLLHILNFKSFDLINKYVAVYSQYKFILKTLLDFCDDLDFKEPDLEVLKNLHLQEEIPVIQNRLFESAPMWK